VGTPVEKIFSFPGVTVIYLFYWKNNQIFRGMTFAEKNYGKNATRAVCLLRL
jgi:hypothetical protein